MYDNLVIDSTEYFVAVIFRAINKIFDYYWVTIFTIFHINF